LILGSQDKSKVGRTLLYKSANLTDWDYVGPFAKSTGVSQQGYVWECPDFFRLADNDILLMSPQGIKENDGRFKNLFNTGYLVGNYNYATNNFEHGEFTELDNGHDFYATQTTLTPDGRRVVVGWMDMWESAMPESEDGWSGALTLPRELIYQDGVLQMRPIKELEQLRTDDLVHEDSVVNGSKQLTSGTKQYEALLDFKANDLEGAGIELKDSQNKNILSLKYQAGKMILNRTGDDGEREAMINVGGNLKLHLFVDTSSVEIFVNDGVRTFTERFYADEAQLNVVTDNETNVSVDVYELEGKAVKF